VGFVVSCGGGGGYNGRTLFESECNTMKQEIAQTSFLAIDRAIGDILSKLSKKAADYDAVVFFASSSYDFPLLSAEIKKVFTKAEVIGISCYGEISPNGFTKQTLLVSALSCQKTRFSGVLIEDVNKFPIVDKAKIEAAATKCGISLHSKTSHKDAFAMTFIDGISLSEETFLSLFYAIIQNDEFIITGGSAGDDYKFRQTYVSYNGQTALHGAVVLFVKTSCAFDIRTVNPFIPAGRKRMTITKSDAINRIIYEIDGINAKKRYAEALGVPENRVETVMDVHPIGRVFSGKIFNSSVIGFSPAGAISVYTRVLPNTVIDVLDPGDSVKIASDHFADIHKKIPHPGCVFIINCLLCTTTFEKLSVCGNMASAYKAAFPVFAGFSSFGEQIGKLNVNQTIISIVIGE